MSARTADPSVILASGALLRGTPDGNIDAGTGASTEGLYVGDTRLLSRWVLRVHDRDLRVAGAVENTTGRSLAQLPSSGRNQTTDLLTLRDQTIVPEGLVERLTLHNTGAEAITVHLEIEAAADFADQFAIRADGRTFDLSAGRRSHRVNDAGALVFEYRHQKGDVLFEAGLRIQASITPVIRFTRNGSTDAATLQWTFALESGAEQVLDLQATSTQLAPAHAVSLPHQPALTETADDGTLLRHRSLGDLDALCMPCPGLPELTIPAAGVPWFLTLFGRDGLISAMLAQPERPGLLPDVVRALAATQGIKTNPGSIEEPGKIVHEIRTSELATLGLVPYARYYGTVDATPLFLTALGALNDTDLVAEMEPAARAAVAWLRTDGGLDAHGFITYTPDPAGLINQGWKDSHDAVAAADGTHATGPIALCEVQGYTWRGLAETARLAREVWNDPDWATELDRIAESLRQRFRSTFWMPAHDFPALALDGQGRQIDALASNAGHLLWSGILNQTDAESVAARLLQPDFYTGWGIRTLAAGQRLFHAMSYHNGSVWPHDTIIAAEGLLHYGLVHSARTAAQGIIDAAGHFDNRLPELFGGFSRTDFPTPVSYGHAGTPQAWACAAAVAAERILAGQENAAGKASPAADSLLN
jgi:glycogen debranching enzyme